jgi:hypothetical protein
MLPVVVAFPCYGRLGSLATNIMIEQLLTTDVDDIVCGVEVKEFYEKINDIPEGPHYEFLVKGIGCGGDMKAVFDYVASGDDKIIIMCDDDIVFHNFPSSLKRWANEAVESGNIATYAFQVSNHFLRMDWKKYETIMDSKMVSMPTLRNKGPVFAISSKNYLSSGGYDPQFHQANDVDIQQRFNILGPSVIRNDFTYSAGTFQEGGMSKFYGVEESRKKYQANTAFALYEMKKKYPWLWKSSVSFKANSTSAVYRTDEQILQHWREGYMVNDFVMHETGLHRNNSVKPYRWYLDQNDLDNIDRLAKIYPDYIHTPIT